MKSDEENKMVQDMNCEEILKYYGIDVRVPIFAYGILRKKGFLQDLLAQFDLEGVNIKPAFIKGFVCYNSNGINITFPATTKQMDKNPKADWLVQGCLLSFYGQPSNVLALYEYIDMIEFGYYKERVATTGGTTAYVYLMSPKIRKLELIKIHSMGQVVYPDTIYHSSYLSPHELYDERAEPTEDGKPLEVPAGKNVFLAGGITGKTYKGQPIDADGYVYTYDKGRVPLRDLVRDPTVEFMRNHPHYSLDDLDYIG